MAVRDSRPMRRLRHRLLHRAVAALLLAGVAVQAVPAAHAEARLDRARLTFVDGTAFDAAWAAAQAAPTPEAAADAFVRAFLETTDLDVPAEALYALLFGDVFRLVLPDTPDAAFVPAPAVPPGPSASGTPDAGQAGATAMPAAGLHPVGLVHDEVTAAGPVALRSALRPRAP